MRKPNINLQTGLDARYDLVKPMLDKGHIEKMSDIFKYVPKTLFFRDLGYRVDRGDQLIERPDGFIVRKLFEIARNCSLKEEEVLILMVNEYRYQKEKKTPPL